jgi:hypothetical protein
MLSRFVRLCGLLSLVQCALLRPAAPPPGLPLARPAAALARRLASPVSTPAGCTAAVRFAVAQEDGQRFVSSASLGMQRPDRLRLEVMGPHGGVIFALASDGARLQVLDARRNQRLEGPASAAQLDDWVHLQLGLRPAELAALLWGRFEAPDDADICQVGSQLRAHWPLGAGVAEATWDPASGNLLTYVRRPGQQMPELRLALGQHTPEGVPRQLEGHLGEAVFKASLRELRCGGALPPGTFDLVPQGGAGTD